MINHYHSRRCVCCRSRRSPWSAGRPCGSRRCTTRTTSGSRKGTKGVSTNLGAPVNLLYLHKSAIVNPSPNLWKIITFAAAPLVLTPFVRNRGSARCCRARRSLPRAILCHTVLYYTMLHYTVLCYAILYCTTLNFTILRCATLRYPTLHYTTLHYTTYIMLVCITYIYIHIHTHNVYLITYLHIYT